VNHQNSKQIEDNEFKERKRRAT